MALGQFPEARGGGWVAHLLCEFQALPRQLTLPDHFRLQRFHHDDRSIRSVVIARVGHNKRQNKQDGEKTHAPQYDFHMHRGPLAGMTISQIWRAAVARPRQLFGCLRH